MNRKKLWLLVIAVLSIFVICAFTGFKNTGDKVAFFSNLNVPADTVVDGDAVVIFGNINVQGTVNGDAVAIFGSVKVDGTLSGDVAAILGTIRVGEKGVIAGDAAGIGGGVKKASGGIVRGETADVTAPFGGNGAGLIPVVTLGTVVGLMISFAFSALVILILPRQTKIMSDESMLLIGRRIGIGMLGYLLFIPIIVALAITIIGILVIPFFILAFSLAIFIGMVAAQIAIGQRLTNKQDGGNTIYINLIIGLAVLFALKLVPILGWLAYFVISALALGVVIDTRLGGAFVRR